MESKVSLTLAGVVSLAFLPSIVTGQTVFSDNFDGNSTANWTLNAGAINDTGNAFFDYSTVGIPSAPHSTGGTTIGMVLKANYPTPGVFAGISASPNGQSFSGNYTVTYDFWQNYNGNANGTGSGTTQLTGAGIGTSGTVSQNAGVTTMSSLWFAQTGDGGNTAASKDYRVYSSAAGGGSGTGYTIASGVYAAGTGTTAADNLNAQYVSLGANTVPTAQTALTATQTGTTPAGAPGFKWHTGQITKTGNTVTYSIDGVPIATVDATSLSFGGSDIELIQTDINAGVSTDPNAATYEFGLFDNIVVTAIPEPTIWTLGLLGLAGLAFARRRNK
jgi:hypothetical protein